MAQYAKINDNIKALMKLIIPKIEDMSANMQTESSHIHTWSRMPMPPISGRYKVQLFPASSSTKTDQTNKINAGSNNQKLILFSLGNAISGNPTYKEHTNSQILNQHRNYKKDHYQIMCCYDNIMYIIVPQNQVPRKPTQAPLSNLKINQSFPHNPEK